MLGVLPVLPVLPEFTGAAREAAPGISVLFPDAGSVGILARSRRAVFMDGGVLAGGGDVGGAGGAGGVAGFTSGIAGLEASVIFEPNVSPDDGFEILRIQLPS